LAAFGVKLVRIRSKPEVGHHRIHYFEENPDSGIRDREHRSAGKFSDLLMTAGALSNLRGATVFARRLEGVPSPNARLPI
jgi:hypothetical protein